VAVLLLLVQSVAAATLGDIFGAFANFGKTSGQQGFSSALDADSDGIITFNDVIGLFLNVVGLGGGSVACSSNGDCGSTSYSGYFCDNNNIAYTTTDRICINPGAYSSRCDTNVITLVEEECLYGCIDMNCMGTCHDYDNGKNYDVNSAITGYTPYGSPFTYFDSCIDASTVEEYYCTTPTYEASTELHYCLHGCLSGYCKAS
jgi:hypothetical protein